MVQTPLTASTEKRRKLPVFIRKPPLARSTRSRHGTPYDTVEGTGHEGSPSNEGIFLHSSALLNRMGIIGQCRKMPLLFPIDSDETSDLGAGDERWLGLHFFDGHLGKMRGWI